MAAQIAMKGLISPIPVATLSKFSGNVYRVGDKENMMGDNNANITRKIKMRSHPIGHL